MKDQYSSHSLYYKGGNNLFVHTGKGKRQVAIRRELWKKQVFCSNACLLPSPYHKKTSTFSF